MNDEAKGNLGNFASKVLESLEMEREVEWCPDRNS